ncbi:hypothetical protein LCGC14_2282520, partial [marine sediment metagenome]
MKRIEPYILPIGIFLCGTVLVTLLFDRALMPRHIVWCIMTIILVYCSKEIRIGFIHWFLLSFLALSLLSGVGVINKAEWLYSVSRIVLMITYISVVKIDKELLAKTMIMLGTVFVIYFWYDYYLQGNFEACRGLMRQRNTWAHAQFFVIPFCYYAIVNKFWKKPAIVILALMVIQVFLLKSRSAILAIVLSSFILAMYSKERWLIVTVICIFLTPFVFANEGLLCTISLNERLEQWNFTKNMMVDYPLGVGSGNWWILFPKYAAGINFPGAFIEKTFRFPHNDFVWICSEIGALGLVCYIGIFVTSLYYAWRDKAIWLVMLVFGYIAIACFSAPHERPFSSLMMANFIAIACPMRLIQQPKILLTVMIFILVVFSFRLKASYWDKKTRYAKTGIQAMELFKAYSPFSTVSHTGIPWHWWRGTSYFESKQYRLAAN